MNTTPIENVVDMQAYVQDYMEFSRGLGHPRNLLAIHKAKLGRQTRTFANWRRLWVWVRPTWTVYVGPVKGICFEVPERATPEQAWNAWREYRKAIEG